MKILLCTDTHFSVHKSSEDFLQSQLRFFREEFIPYAKKHNIDTIVHAGDLFDNRNSINVRVLNEVYKLFSEDFKDFNVYILVGNHDSYFKNTIETHSLKTLKDLPNITVVDDIQLHTIGNREILMVPWINDQDEFKRKVANQNATEKICIGHLEIVGFFLNKGKKCDVGLDPETFLNNFSLTFSGHFHKRSKIERGDKVVQYFGNCYHLTRHDVGEDRGFCELDLDTLDYKFINTTTTIRYERLIYPESFTEDRIKGNIIDVHVNVHSEYDEADFQSYIMKIDEFNPIEPANIRLEDEMTYSTSEEYHVQSVPDMLEEYVDDLDVKYKDEIKDKVIDLYNENKNSV